MRGSATGGGTAAGAGSSSIVSLSLQATARVYVCLLGDGGRKLIAGTELQPGATTPTFHARRFKITLGKRIGMVVESSEVSTARDRRRGYDAALAGAGIPLDPALVAYANADLRDRIAPIIERFFRARESESDSVIDRRGSD